MPPATDSAATASAVAAMPGCCRLYKVCSCLSFSLTVFLSLSPSLPPSLPFAASLPVPRCDASRPLRGGGCLGTTVTSTTRWGFLLTQAGPLPLDLRHGRGPCGLCPLSRGRGTSQMTWAQPAGGVKQHIRMLQLFGFQHRPGMLRPRK